MIATGLKDDVMQEFLDRTQASRTLYETARRDIPSGTTRAPFYHAPYPIYMKRGEGAYLWDIDGNRYLDFQNNMGPLVLGHRHPQVQKAVEAQVDALWCGAPTELEVKLAREIKRAFPFAERVLFTPSGSEATMKLIRAARAATGKDRIMLAEGAYHGSHDIVTSSPGIPGSYQALVTRYSYNDEESFVASFRKVKEELGAVLVEALLGRAGSVPPTETFMKVVREETDKAGVPLLVDEVVSGFRVARGGVCEVMGIRPDGVALGKIIGGGFPVGAFLGTERLMKQYEYGDAPFPMVGRAPLPQSGTFNAFPVSMAAGLATLELLTPEAYDHLRWVGRESSNVLDKVADDCGVPHVMTGIGSIFFMHFASSQVKNFETAIKADESKRRLLDALLLGHGVNVPPAHSAFGSLPMGKSEISRFEEAVVSAFADMKEIGAV